MLSKKIFRTSLIVSTYLVGSAVYGPQTAQAAKYHLPSPTEVESEIRSITAWKSSSPKGMVAGKQAYVALSAAKELTKDGLQWTLYVTRHPVGDKLAPGNACMASLCWSHHRGKRNESQGRGSPVSFG